MITTWSYSITSETARLLHTAHNIHNRFYPINGFLVLPEAPAKLEANQVIFPHLPYSKAFWHTAHHTDISQPITPPASLVSEMKQHLPLAKPDRPLAWGERPAPSGTEEVTTESIPTTFTMLQQSWSQAEPEILSFLSKLLASTIHDLRSIHIHPTLYGTQASYNRVTKNQPNLVIYARQDLTLPKLVDIVIDALVSQQLEEKLDATWSETHIIADWLLTATKLKNIVEKYDPTPYQPLLKSLRSKQNQSKLVEKSQRYLSKLGYLHQASSLSLINNYPHFQNERIRNLSPKEAIVLTQLIDHKSLSTDQLADLIFTSDEKFSLYALAKFIQRLRGKLEQNGLTGSIIQTLRGQGYSLKS